MNFLLKIFFLLITFLFSSPIFSQDSLKIISYNIEGMKPGTNPSLRLSHIIDELKILDPDIIALQEINQAVSGNGSDNQGQVIANALSEHFDIEYHYYQKFTHLSWDNQFREYIGIVSKYPVLDEGFFQLVAGVFPRKVVWNYIETPIGSINFFSTHLSFNSQSVRLVQVQQIDSYLSQIQENNTAVNNILCGDFNDIPTAPSISFLREESGLSYFDSHKEANPNSNGFTVPSNTPNARIDYIFYTAEETTDLISSQIVMENSFAGNMYPSDHLGVMSIFTDKSNSIINPAEVVNQSKKFFKIDENYPTPYTSDSFIKYELFYANVVKISLINTAGQLVQVLTNKKLMAGKQTIHFNTSRFKEQVLFMKIEVEGSFEILKLIIE